MFLLLLLVSIRRFGCVGGLRGGCCSLLCGYRTCEWGWGGERESTTTTTWTTGTRIRRRHWRISTRTSTIVTPLTSGTDASGTSLSTVLLLLLLLLLWLLLRWLSVGGTMCACSKWRDVDRDATC